MDKAVRKMAGSYRIGSGVSSVHWVNPVVRIARRLRSGMTGISVNPLPDDARAIPPRRTLDKLDHEDWELSDGLTV